MNNLAIVYDEMGEFEKSRTIFQNLFDESQESGDDESKAGAANNLAITALYQGRFNESRDLAAMSLDIYSRLENAEGLATAHSNWFEALINLGMSTDAARAAEPLMSMSNEFTEDYFKSNNLGLSARFKLIIGDTPAAHTLLQQAVDMADHAGNLASKAKLLLYLALTLLAQGDAREASRSWKRAQSTFDERIGRPHYPFERKRLFAFAQTYLGSEIVARLSALDEDTLT